MDALLVMTSLPDQASAETLAAHLVDSHLAACVNLLAPCKSVYRWQDKREQATEFPLLIKTTQARYAEVEAAIREQHPYELPEVIALPLVAGLPAYLDWVRSETTVKN